MRTTPFSTQTSCRPVIAGPFLDRPARKARSAAAPTACLLIFLLAGCTGVSSPTRVTIDRDSGMWTASDGHQMPFRVWPNPAGPPDFEIIAVHGLGGRDSDFLPVIPLMESIGGRLVAINLRGMGLEQREQDRGQIRDGYRWVTDLDEFIRHWTEETADLPRLIVAESLGAVIALHWMQRTAEEGKIPLLDGAILLSPVVAIDGEFQAWQRLLYWFLRTFAPRYRIRPADFADPDQPPPRVTRDLDYAVTLEQAPHRLDALSIGILAQMQRMIVDARDIKALPSFPVFLAYGGEDIFIKAPAVQDYFLPRRGETNWTEAFYPDGFHLLLHDPETPDLVGKLEAWIKETLQQRHD